MNILEAPAGVVCLAGAAGIGDADLLQRTLSEAIQNNPAVVVDLAGIDGCDAAVVQLLCSLWKSATRCGKQVSVSLSPAVRECLAATGLSAAEIPTIDGGGDGL